MEDGVTKSRRGRFYEHDDLITSIMGSDWESILQNNPGKKVWVERCEQAAEKFLREHRLPSNPLVIRKNKPKEENQTSFDKQRRVGASEKPLIFTNKQPDLAKQGIGETWHFSCKSIICVVDNQVVAEVLNGHAKLAG